MRRTAALLAAVVLAVAGCGGGGGHRSTTTTPAAPAAVPDRHADGVTFHRLGSGTGSVWVVRPDAAGDRPLPVVLFVHGWTAADPRIYGAWIVHLAREGREVVFPVYQVLPYVEPAQAFGAMVVGIRRALADPARPVLRDGWVAAGHSAGGALVADYASAARRLGLPVPRAILSVYPGRAIPGIPLRLPEVDPRGVPAGIRVEALAGDDDQTVGTSWARRIARTAADGTFHLVTDDAVDDHIAPIRTTETARRTFWAPLDRLIAATR